LAVKVKICCIANLEEAQLAIDHGASAIGLVGKMPSGPGIITDQQIHTISKVYNSISSTFLLTSETKAESIIQHYYRTQTNTIQIVDSIEEEDYKRIRAALPKIKLVQVIHVTDQNSIQDALNKSKFVDTVLLDSGNPNLKIKELGGTGRTHNWKISRQIVKAVNVPVFLAGGLKPDNVKEAINIVKPYGVDLCSGVRTNGMLDTTKLAAFFKAIKN